MKQNTAENNLMIEEERLVAHEADGATKARREFAKKLRALGQAIEKFKFSTFDLELESGIYIVTGKATVVENAKIPFCRFVFDLLRGTNPARTITATVAKTELRFSPEEIETFELRGQVRRQDPSKMPDPYSVSQILRGAGSYLDSHEGAVLEGITLKDKWVTVKYRTTDGRLEQAKQDLEYFYDYWVKMYMRRRNRSKLPPPSDPTLFVTWEDIQKAHRLSAMPR